MMFVSVRSLATSINEKRHIKPEEILPGQAAQWIADCYHCSDNWGQEMSENDMYITLIESEKEKDPDNYSPDPALYKLCTAYRNDLCHRYPN